MNIMIQKLLSWQTRLLPCITQNTNMQRINIRNFNMNIIEAAEQCDRLSLPILEKVAKIRRFSN